MQKNRSLWTIEKLEVFFKESEYKCWDPFDGLNSRLLKPVVSLGVHSINILIVQFFKRSPLNFRWFFGVPQVYNFKGIALILKGYVNQYKMIDNGNSKKDQYLRDASYLSNLILENNHHYSKDSFAWGYGHHWEARGGLKFPRNSPNIVVTSFCANALLDLYEVNKNPQLLAAATSTKKYVVDELKRSYSAEGFLFSYSHLKGNATVYNASALACQLLLRIHYYSPDVEALNIATSGLSTICKKQNSRGGWRYGDSPFQTWEDSFHTGFILECLGWYKNITSCDRFDHNIQKGLDYYLQTFFSADGLPKYYHNKTFPIDCHCIAQLPITLSVLKDFRFDHKISHQVMDWSFKNMQLKSGLFRYKKYKYFCNNINYSRWTQSWMYYALTTHLLNMKSE